MENYFIYCSDFNSVTPLEPKARAVAKLPTTITNGEYEIALLETHVCVGWANLTNAGVRLEKTDSQTGVKQDIEFTLNDGIIDTSKRLFNMLNEAIEKRMTASEEIDDWAK